jgi:hypothetical protein
MIVGESDWILGATSSLDRNLNGCGLGEYTTDSPVTDEDYTPNAAAPAWDFRVVYEAWVANVALGGAALGDVNIEYVHASPSKTVDTLTVIPGPCPPAEEVPPSPPTTTVPPTTTPPSSTPPPSNDSPDAGTDEPSDGGTGPSRVPQVR